MASSVPCRRASYFPRALCASWASCSRDSRATSTRRPRFDRRSVAGRRRGLAFVSTSTCARRSRHRIASSRGPDQATRGSWLARFVVRALRTARWPGRRRRPYRLGQEHDARDARRPNQPIAFGHVITIEDPIEYVHESKGCLVDQRQVGTDTTDFQEALVASLRQDPDVVLVGEVREIGTIRTAITAAETGHLVFTTVHAGDCVGVIERLVSVFPADEQPGVRRQLALVLKAVVCQHLLLADGRVVSATR
ncbi:MAG: ATPase, T2SS/T4P/T4SS family [Pirellulaceae bacterium]